MFARVPAAHLLSWRDYLQQKKKYRNLPLLSLALVLGDIDDLLFICITKSFYFASDNSPHAQFPKTTVGTPKNNSSKTLFLENGCSPKATENRISRKHNSPKTQFPENDSFSFGNCVFGKLSISESCRWTHRSVIC